jgi:hypothetical protein
MRVYVSSIRPAASGFGQYDRGEEVEADGDWDSVEEFAAHVASDDVASPWREWEIEAVADAIEAMPAEQGDDDEQLR